MIEEFEKVTENDLYEFGYYGFCKSINEQLSKLKTGYFCLTTKNKQNSKLESYIIFDKDGNIVKDSTKIEDIIAWVDMLFIHNDFKDYNFLL